MNHQFSFIPFKETFKFEYILLEVANRIWKKMDKVLISQGFLSVKQHNYNSCEKKYELTLIMVKKIELQVNIDNFKILLLLL